MYNFIFILYSLAGERTVTIGEGSSGDIAIFLILSRKMKTGAITSAGFYLVPYYIRGRAITIFLELERCYFSPQVLELCMATWQKCIFCCYNTDKK